MPIEWNDLLLTLGEIAIAITGFAGIVGAFSTRGGRDRGSQVFLQLRWMLDYSLLALFNALLPYLVFSFEISDSMGWRIVSGTSLLVVSTYQVMERSLIRDILVDIRKRGAGSAFLLGDVAAGVLILLNVTGILFEPQALPHVAVVFYSLAGASLGFAKLVTVVWATDET